MELLVLIALIFFFGIGVVFEVIGFLFRLIFSGFGLVLGLVLASVVALAIVPVGVALLGFVIPKALIIAGAVLLLVLSTVRYRRENRRYDRRRSYRDDGYRGYGGYGSYR